MVWLSFVKHHAHLTVFKSCYHNQQSEVSSRNKSVDVCYSLLDVDPDCSEEELRSAYLEKVKEYHPDRNTLASDANKFSVIQEAYKVALDELRWEFHCAEFRQRVQEINEMINKYNFIVPFMEKQMVHYNIERNVDKILEHHVDYLPKDSDGKPLQGDQLGPLPQVHAENVKIGWGEVWSNIKNVFTFR
ncbi:DnaJ-like protein subfamily C member 28 [Elysia marginata]|uniref:DnaJ-like protein subfamily C member 28 n=1 Tax=Elysia marginata TaxID=1093978 RepID=A0AAV4HMQ0_9GAST|nr:DnaJ-like protein subfamily C member 28 [Elysia marginata]